ncbi:Endo-beta-1,4-glucanase D [Colletotrichum trifolii]|uniref:Endo-beta-1,4-glucanase D n=1 Tax=Colletotrichum trifolii TaxID=5466 RepID=A0A4V3HR76_COLTR|nr:Endo-beta-1,4-glucanase D [Colletotrichum trifolii]
MTLDWEYVRKTTNFQSNGPVTDANSQQITCYQLAPGGQGAKVLDVAAGSTIGYNAKPSVSHPGPVNFYMAKAPSGTSIAKFEGSGKVWFKIYNDGPTVTSGGLIWPTSGKTTINVQIPKCLEDGEHFLRVEHIALHSASSIGGAQLYISCAQLRVSGGTATYRPNLVSFPGAYSPNDPGLVVNIYYPVPTNDKTPGGAFEFFAFPAYFHNVTATNLCLANLKALSGTWPPIRIGGTTQDRASYDANLVSEVVYSVENPVDAPKALKFGPSFFELAATYAGNVTLGLNRGKNDIDNTIAAAKAAVQSIGNLYAIELGNEPEYWAKTQPTASDAWDPAIDAASQNEWAIIVGNAIDKKDIVQAGNSNSLPPRWGAQELIASGNITAREFVRTYSHHNYPGGNVSSLMSHSNTVNNVHL